MGLKKTLNEHFEVEYRKEVWLSPFGFLQHVLPQLEKRGKPMFTALGMGWNAELWVGEHRTPKAFGPTLYEAAARLLAADIEREKVGYFERKAIVMITPTEVKAKGSDPLSMAKLWAPRYRKMLNAEIENLARYSAKTEPHARP